ncbi:hypothetical protein BT63DRAFT_194531 [Microthyrium microscopicum]|uniref:Acyltransferase 3 domain-containing protein n=1 Tax=Microthyrium microscopicum TaxID=703497 RepID=A0A6A6UKQ4_9PEZI|nr:hypothetical protein BT63DRAFT_194531 [Microthyrium microscopicum]
MSGYLPSVPDSSSEKWVPDLPTFNARKVVLSFVPRFVRRGGLRRTEKLRSTAYLDALRGVAAVIVVNHHHIYPITELPFINLWTLGKSSVNVFFVISGYALSYSLLKKMRARDSPGLLDTFASSMFRRWMRLYLSCFFATFLALILVRMGRLGYLHRFDYLHTQIFDWMRDCVRFSNPFVGPRGYKIPGNGDYNTGYLDPLWTIPLEFRGSVVIYAFCLATCRMVTKYRMMLCAGLIYMCYVWSSIYIALFLGGVLVADISLSRSSWASEQLPPSTTEGPAQKSMAERVGWWSLLIFSLFLLSQPDEYSATTMWPWPYLRTLVPEHLGRESEFLAQHFWLSIGSILLVFTLDSYPTFQTPLLWDIPQYLGELSFGIYVVHVLLMWSFWYITVEPFRAAYFGDSRFARYPTYVIYFAFVVWAGELFCKVDNALVKFGKWLQGKVFYSLH